MNCKKCGKPIIYTKDRVNEVDTCWYCELELCVICDREGSKKVENENYCQYCYSHEFYLLKDEHKWVARDYFQNKIYNGFTIKLWNCRKWISCQSHFMYDINEKEDTHEWCDNCLPPQKYKNRPHVFSEIQEHYNA
jgi:hypothetical protein